MIKRTGLLAAVLAAVFLFFAAGAARAELLVRVHEPTDDFPSFGTIYRVDERSGAVTGVFTSGPHVGPALGMAFGPDGNLYVGHSQGGGVARYNGATGAFIDVFTSGASLFARDLAFGPDGNLYVTGVFTPSVMRFNGATGAFMDVFATRPLVGAGAPLIAFGPNGDLFMTQGAGMGVIRVLRFDGTTGAQVATYEHGIIGLHTGPVFSRDGRFMFVGGGEQLGIFDFAFGGKDYSYSGGGFGFLETDIVLGPDDFFYISTFGSGVVRHQAFSGNTVETVAPFLDADGFSRAALELVFTPTLVPEPGTLLLLSLGIAGLLLTRRR